MGIDAKMKIIFLLIAVAVFCSGLLIGMGLSLNEAKSTELNALKICYVDMASLIYHLPPLHNISSSETITLTLDCIAGQLELNGP